MTFLQNLLDVLNPDSKTISEVRAKLSQRPQLDSKQFADSYFPIEKRSVAKRLMEITKEHSVADIAGLSPDDAFISDLRMDDLDSLSTVEFILHLEKEFDIAIPEKKAKKIRKFSELVDEICYQIKGKSNHASQPTR